MALTLCLALAACGFEPLYGEGAGRETVAEMAEIGIAPMPDRIGQKLRNALIDQVTPRGQLADSRYQLDVVVTTRRDGVAVQRDATVTRFNLYVSAQFRLFDRQTPPGERREPLLAGRSHTIAAFNALSADFANIMAERDAEDRAARDLASDITQRLAAFFRRRAGA